MGVYWGASMLKNLALVFLFVFGLCASARADFVATYDWNFQADAPVCGGGPGCVGFEAGSLTEAGTFTIDSPTDLLGASGILTTLTPNYDLIAASITSVTTSEIHSKDSGGTPSGFWQAVTGEVAVPVEWDVTSCPPVGDSGCSVGIFTGVFPGTTTLNYSLESVDAVPEPSTWAMLLIGFAGIGFAGWRRASRRASNIRLAVYR
jgi:PEP-CTERM motif